MKICTRCKMEMPLEKFSKDKTRSDGLSKWCKDCVAENGKKHYEVNKDKRSQQAKEWRDANLERCQENASRYYEDHRDEIRAREAQRYQDNKEAILEKSKWQHVMRKYGLTKDDFFALLESQDFQCAICETDEPGGRGGWHVDHDHSCCPGLKTCGKCIRALLCMACNSSIGFADDNPERLIAMAEYIRHHHDRIASQYVKGLIT